MKKVVVVCAVLFAAILGSTHVEAKGSQKGFYSGNTYQKGQFRFTYMAEEKGIWITKITPLSGKGISTLKIPSRLNGSKVVKLGAAGDDFSSENGDDYDRDTNLFGVEYTEEDNIEPQTINNRVKKIKTIKIPSTVKKISYNCFKNIQDGKKINVPAGITKNVILTFTRVKWSKVTISPKNKKYKVANGCLLSKNGKLLYGFAEKKKKIIIPSTVNRIVDDRGKYEGCSVIVIPKSVKKIDKHACSTTEPVRVKVAKGNRRYAVKNGSVYSKVSGRLVLGYVKNGILDVPEKVTRIDGHGTLGYGHIEKVILHKGIKKIKGFYDMSVLGEGNLACVLYCRKPPKLVEPYSFIGLRVYVPKNCKSRYLKKKQWKILSEDSVLAEMQ